MEGQLASLFTVSFVMSLGGRGKEEGLIKRTNSPSCGVKVLAGRPDGESNLLYLGGEGGDAGEGGVKQTVVDLI